MMITSRALGSTASGEEIVCFDLQNQNGMIVSVLNYGCTIQRILVPDRAGRRIDVALGYDDTEDYARGSSYFGALIGRYANRIRSARFSLNGKVFVLSPNDGENHLHGVFHHTVFSAQAQDRSVFFRHISPPEEEGYPGTLSVAVRYSLTEANELILQYEAETDADTILNLTNHTYFNLNGCGNVLNHSLRLRSEAFAENGDGTLPTGKLIPVAGTPMDFRSPRTIGKLMDPDDPQIALFGGYDHHFVLDCVPGECLPFAELVGEKSGIRMTASTTQPGVQFYTGNYVQDDSAPFGKDGRRYEKHAGLCLETQHAPDSPNLPAFPSAILRPGERYYQKTIFQFQ